MPDLSIFMKCAECVNCMSMWNKHLMKYLFILLCTTSLATMTIAQSGAALIIGRQEWMAQNLDVDVYWDGVAIPEAKTIQQWRAYNASKTGCYCRYDNELCYGSMYGKLYNWYAIKRGVAPRCWRVATKQDFDRLVIYLGADSAAQKLKSTHSWNNDWNGNNKSTFNALAAGCRNANGTFSYVGREAFWWVADGRKTGPGKETGLYLFLNYDNKYNYEASTDFGFSVRCVRDVGEPYPKPCD